MKHTETDINVPKKQKLIETGRNGQKERNRQKQTETERNKK